MQRLLLFLCIVIALPGIFSGCRSCNSDSGAADDRKDHDGGDTTGGNAYPNNDGSADYENGSGQDGNGKVKGSGVLDTMLVGKTYSGKAAGVPAVSEYSEPAELPVPVVYFAGHSRYDTTITMHQLTTARGITAALPDNKAKRFTISRWTFNAFYKGDLVGHVSTNGSMTEDMRILIAQQQPGDVVIIDNAVAKDAQGQLYYLDDLKLRIQ